MKFWISKEMQAKPKLRKNIVNFLENTIRIKIKEIRTQANFIRKLIERMKFCRTKIKGKCLINRAMMVQTDMKGKFFYFRIQNNFLIFLYFSGQHHIKKGPNARADVSLTMKEMYLGSKRKMNINRNIYCDPCRGTGAKGGNLKKCPKCKG